MVYSILISLAVLFAVARLYTFYHGKAPAPMMLGDGLGQCPDKPNCVCSEFPEDKSHYIESLSLTHTELETVLSVFSKLVIETGGKIDSENSQSLSARFTTKWMGYVDDVHIRIDDKAARVHFRSASRLGHSDFGMNRERIEALKMRYLQTVKST